MRSRSVLLALLALVLLLPACASQFLPGGLPGNLGVQTPVLTYDGAITVVIKNGMPLAGTNLGYQGKSVDGRALLLIGGQQAAKQLADSVNFSGTIVPGTSVRLNTRVGPYDQSSVNLIGTVHIEIEDAQPNAAEPSQDIITAFGIPVQYRVNRGDSIPGTLVQFLGQTSQGAQFSNLGEFPYRSQLDSVVWNGHLRDKVALKLDLRLLNASEDNAALVGTAQIRFEK